MKARQAGILLRRRPSLALRAIDWTKPPSDDNSSVIRHALLLWFVGRRRGRRLHYILGFYIEPIEEILGYDLHGRRLRRLDVDPFRHFTVAAKLNLRQISTS